MKGGDDADICLIFAFDMDMSPDAQKLAEQQLEERTGEKCVVVPLCTGVVHVASEKSHLTEGIMQNQDRSETTHSRNVRGAKIIQAIETTELVGKGTEESPCYLERLYWSLDGKLLAIGVVDT